MNVQKQKTIRSQAMQKIQQLPATAILRQDLAELWCARQVSRALKALVQEGVLVKLGYGIYAKTRRAYQSQCRTLRLK